ncbi:hypothetical protein [Fulvivirga ligni]|uniref:hypothetical protein n=1 Tax=Fulvivirga ligni TaxID=2904246 RepID=UPI001F47FCA7|nr:hypothetical protein [Fulvivirga ligni]UII19521.1 hypothetical protein LVD16_16900 [Fulvivirga ligni]
MIRKDYILKEIQKLHLLMAKILGLRTEGRNLEALDMLDHHIAAESGLALEDIMDMDEQQLIDEIKETVDLKLVDYTILAETTYVAAEIKKDEGDIDAALNLFAKSLILFNYVTLEERTVSFEREQKIANISQHIQELKDLAH